MRKVTFLILTILLSVSITIGVHPTPIGRFDTDYANGLIDNVIFFSQELNQFDIDFLYNMGNGTEDWGVKHGTTKTTRTIKSGNI